MYNFAIKPRLVLASGRLQRRSGPLAARLSQLPDQHRPKRPVLLAVDQELGEGPGLGVVRQRCSLERLGLHGEEPPFVWNAPQFVLSTVLEHEAGAGSKV